MTFEQKTDQKSPDSPRQSSSTAPDEKAEDRSRFECNICLEGAQDPVVTRCGHLYCWPCLHTWLETRRENPLCPVCKSVVNKDEVTPIYGKSGGNVDPRTKTVPPRPSGQRTEDPGQADAYSFPWGFQQNGVHANVHFSFGFGLFPFTLMASMFNGGPNVNQHGGDPDQFAVETNTLSNIFLGIGCLFILWLILT